MQRHGPPKRPSTTWVAPAVDAEPLSVPSVSVAVGMPHSATARSICLAFPWLPSADWCHETKRRFILRSCRSAASEAEG